MPASLPQGVTAFNLASIFPGSETPVLAEFRVALVGNFSPKKCGIATFTTDLSEQLSIHHPEIAVDVHALDDAHEPLEYPGIENTIIRDDPASFATAARRINEAGVDAVWVQHEYGIFGGPDGEMVCDFVDRLAAPLILTCHTVLAKPSERQGAIMRHLVTRASRIMVMSPHGRDLLASLYGARPEIVEVIEHGAPDRPFGRQDEFKAVLGLTGRKVMMTFGLLGPGKGIETVLEAMPDIIAQHPNVIYRIVGATHPNLVAEQGEAYRERLASLADGLGVSDHIEWVDSFLETSELLDQLEACDIYITPYPGLQQSTSGTLSYAVALGKAVVSTKYLHARELLANDVGRLIEPRSSTEIAKAVNQLFGNPEELAAMQRRAYARGRETIWPRFADATAKLALDALAPAPHPAPLSALPGLTGLFDMSDATGMMQHAIGIIPDRRHGYCLDDNARALMLMNVADGVGQAERSRWCAAYAGFVQHAWNPDVARFRNFMRFDRSWCEDAGSEDSNGRALWSLGQTAELSPNADLRAWALQLYEQVLPSFATIDSPRALAFAMLGAGHIARCQPDHVDTFALLERGGDLLERLLGGGRRPDWAWFEQMLGYDNPRLPQALIVAGVALNRSRWIEAGLETLNWISRRQSSALGHFRPIGSETFGKAHDNMPFDQQPLEAQAAIEAAELAYRVTGNMFWAEHALMAWRWFFGGNDRGVVLADIASGRCRDGVTPRGVNANCGAESILAFQLSYYCVLAIASSTKADGKGRVLEPARKTIG